MKLRIKRLNDSAVVPAYAKDGDACFDLTATSVNVEVKFIEYGTGLAVEIPKGYVGLLFPRSSVTNKDLMLKNSVGIIDSGYRGEIRFRFQNTSKSEFRREIYNAGERIGQMMIMPVPTVEIEEVDELTDTERGEGGYGSTGK